MKTFPLLLLAALLLILGCSRQESPGAVSIPFSKSAFVKRTESAFFSDSALKELRLLRNEIFARHGRIFDSHDLRDHFGKTAWYKPSRTYSDAMLSKQEREVVGSIQACETYLQEAGDKGRQHYDSVKTLYRFGPRLDTTIIDHIDYTGDGKKDACITRITRRGDSVLVHHVIVSRKDTIYNRTCLASFAPDKDLPLFDVYNNLATALRLSPFKASLNLVSPDIKKQYNGKKELKQYLAHFKGQILVTVTSESVGCGYFWYAPKKRFETLYCE
jgi:hypothetical protein